MNDSLCNLSAVAVTEESRGIQIQPKWAEVVAVMPRPPPIGATWSAGLDQAPPVPVATYAFDARTPDQMFGVSTRIHARK
jgi:hypothetical protein